MSARQDVVARVEGITPEVFAMASTESSSGMGSGGMASKLQAAQNACLRLVTGTHRMAAEDFLHDEAKVLKVREHWDLLSTQYLAATYCPSHPCHELSFRTQGLREVHKSLHLRHRDQAEARLIWDPGIPGPTRRLDRKATFKGIHSSVVRDALQNREQNRVLGARPPAVSCKEKRLPRASRSVLAQFRSGFSIHTNHYRHRVWGVPDACPSCNGTPHVFNCHARRTALSTVT